MQNDFEVVCQRMREQLAAAHPGRLFLTLNDACAAIGIAQKTLRNWRSCGVTPLKISRVGQKRLVAITDLAEAAARIALGEDVKAPPRPRRMGGEGKADVITQERRGRPSNVERAAAKALGLTVPQLRASQGEG